MAQPVQQDALYQIMLELDELEDEAAKLIFRRARLVKKLRKLLGEGQDDGNAD